MFIRFLATIFAVTSVALSGCASTQFVDAQVQSFARAGSPPLPGQAVFGFERLPSQHAGSQTHAEPNQKALENAVAARLIAFGWTSADSGGAQFSVQVSTRSTLLASAWDNQWPWPHQHWDSLARHPVLLRSGTWAWVSPLGSSFAVRSGLEPNTAVEVTVLVRNNSTGEVVFESTAKTSARTGSSAGSAVEEFSALAAAAMAEFPSANPKPRLKRQPLQP